MPKSVSVRVASRRYLEILQWAALNSESAMGAALKKRLDTGEELDFERLVEMSQQPCEKPLDLEIRIPDIGAYDALLQEVTL